MSRSAVVAVAPMETLPRIAVLAGILEMAVDIAAVKIEPVAVSPVRRVAGTMLL